MAKEKRSIKGFKGFFGRINAVFGKKINQNKGGFTLIELLVVILIIGILTSVALPQYQKAVVKAKTFRLLPLMRAVDSAEQLYFLANGNYTNKFTDLDITLPAGNASSTDSHLYYEDFHCWFYVGNAENSNTYSVECQSTDPMAPIIEKYFSLQDFWCWHYGNQFKRELCAGIAGSKPYSGIDAYYF